MCVKAKRSLPRNEKVKYLYSEFIPMHCQGRFYQNTKAKNLLFFIYIR